MEHRNNFESNSITCIAPCIIYELFTTSTNTDSNGLWNGPHPDSNLRLDWD